jgi:hypothetical protein
MSTLQPAVDLSSASTGLGESCMAMHKRLFVNLSLGVISILALLRITVS